MLVEAVNMEEKQEEEKKSMFLSWKVTRKNTWAVTVGSPAIDTKTNTILA